MPNIETQVHDWATEAADAYLNRKVELNTSIKKIAGRETLNREKIARVAEEANKQVFLKLFDKQADKTFTFPVADVEQIVVEEKPTVKVGTFGRVTPPEPAPLEKSASEKISEASFNGFPSQIGWDVYEKSILGLELIREKAMMAEEMTKKAQLEFCKTAQQMVLQEDYSYEEICQALTSIRPRDFPKVAFLLKVAAKQMGRDFLIPKEAFEKHAGAAVDSGEHDIISQISASGMPVEVINGSHKIVIALDTLVNQTLEWEKANAGLRSADDSVKYLRREIRNHLATTRCV